MFSGEKLCAFEHCFGKLKASFNCFDKLVRGPLVRLLIVPLILCKSIYMSISILKHLYMMHTHTSTHTHAHALTNTHTHKHTHTNTHTHIHFSFLSNFHPSEFCAVNRVLFAQNIIIALCRSHDQVLVDFRFHFVQRNEIFMKIFSSPSNHCWFFS